MFRTIARKWIFIAVGVALATSAGSVEAKRGKPRTAVVDVAGARTKLAGGDTAGAVNAARALAGVNKEQRADAIAALSAALAVGVAPEVAAAALDALAQLGGREALAVVRSYRGHRRARVRSASLRALAALDLDGAKATIVAALGDREPDVRATAGKLIGEHDIRAAVDPLVALLRRGDEVAVQALGQLGDSQVAAKVAELIGVAPDALVSHALGAILLNPKFGPDDARLEVVKTLGGVPGSESIEALSNYVASVPAKPARDSRAEAELIVEKRLTEGGK